MCLLLDQIVQSSIKLAQNIELIREKFDFIFLIFLSAFQFILFALLIFCFVSSETKRYCFQFRGELFT